MSEKKSCKPNIESGHDLFLETMFRSMTGASTPHGENHCSEAIYASEKRGQSQFVKSESLPSKCRESDEVLESIGIQVGKPFEEDPLFRPAILPDGWKKKATDHDIWSEIVDEKGRVRIGVFYKAAFYDRKADMRLERRYRVSDRRTLRSIVENIGRYEKMEDKSDDDDVIVIDYGTVPPTEIFHKAVPRRSNELSREERCERLDTIWKIENEANEWLKENYPEYESPSAYWDNE